MTAAVREVPALQARCDWCKWRGPCHDADTGNARVLAERDASDHDCGMAP